MIVAPWSEADCVHASVTWPAEPVALLSVGVSGSGRGVGGVTERSFDGGPSLLAVAADDLVVVGRAVERRESV